MDPPFCTGRTFDQNRKGEITMSTAKKKNWMRLLVPGFIFQSIVIAGGYGTGAEICQYFLVNGTVGGLLGMVVTTILWSVLCAVTFEFARMFKTFDYKSLMTKLLGKPGHILYEVSYVVLMLMVLGVCISTAGSMVADITGLTPWIGIILLSVGIVLLITKGTKAIETVLSFWSYVLYAVYILFMIICFTKFGSNIGASFAAGEVGSSWFVNGAQYAFYNLGCVPLFLYTIRDCDTRKEAVTSGLLSGLIAVIPAALLLIVLSGVEGTVTADVPVSVVFNTLDMKWLYILFEIVLFGTLIETGAGFIKAIDDRIELAVTKNSKTSPSWLHPTIAIVGVVLGIIVAQFGLIALIAKGYGTMCWIFMIIFAVPMVTIGLYKIIKAK